MRVLKATPWHRDYWPTGYDSLAEVSSTTALGVFGSGSEEPNAIVQLGEGASTIPNLKATQVELFDGLSARTVVGWPSLEIDLYAINNRIDRLLPAGFYYKTFMRPRFLWDWYEGRIRHAAGLGFAPTEPDSARYDKRNAHCLSLIHI